MSNYTCPVRVPQIHQATSDGRIAELITITAGSCRRLHLPCRRGKQIESLRQHRMGIPTIGQHVLPRVFAIACFGTQIAKDKAACLLQIPDSELRSYAKVVYRMQSTMGARQLLLKKA